jgi:anti-sigma factor RsiW
MDEAMECKQGDQMTMLMSLSLDGMLDRDGQHRLERHLAGCASCQWEWQAMRQVTAMFEAEPMIGPPLGFSVRIERRLEAKAKQRKRAFGGAAVVTSWLSLAGVTVGAVMLILLGVVGWQWLGSLDSVQTGASALSLVAGNVSLLGKGASLFLGEALLRYGLPLVALLAVGLAVLAGAWTWMVVKRPGGSRRNGFV